MIAGGFDISAASVFVVAPLFALQIENATGNAAPALPSAARSSQVPAVLFSAPLCVACNI